MVSWLVWLEVGRIKEMMIVFGLGRSTLGEVDDLYHDGWTWTLFLTLVLDMDMTFQIRVEYGYHLLNLNWTSTLSCS